MIMVKYFFYFGISGSFFPLSTLSPLFYSRVGLEMIYIEEEKYTAPNWNSVGFEVGFFRSRMMLFV